MSGLKDFATDAALSTLKGGVDVGQKVVGVGDALTGGRATSTLKKIGYDPEKTNQFLTSNSSQQFQNNQKQFSSLGLVDKAKMLAQNPAFAAKKASRLAPNILADAALSKGIPIGNAGRASSAAGAITSSSASIQDAANKAPLKLTDYGNAAVVAGGNYVAGQAAGRIASKTKLGNFGDAFKLNSLTNKADVGKTLVKGATNKATTQATQFGIKGNTPKNFFNSPVGSQKQVSSLALVDSPEVISPTFDPEGDGYDYHTAQSLGLKPNDQGIWPDTDPKTGQLLKGRKHKDFNSFNAGVIKGGHTIGRAEDGRYYSTAPTTNIQNGYAGL